jgi:hypothetical protein
MFFRSSASPLAPATPRHHVTTTQHLTGAAEGADDDDRTLRSHPTNIGRFSHEQTLMFFRSSASPLAPATPRHHVTTTQHLTDAAEGADDDD